MKGLKCISWYDRSGYGVAARRYIRGLLRAGVPLTWTPMVSGKGWGKRFGYEPFFGPSVGDPFLDPICNKRIEYDTVLIHLVPEYFPRWSERESGKRIIGYTTWETDRIPDHWLDILNRLERVWVPSTWNENVLKSSGVTAPVDVIPHILGSASLHEPDAVHPLMKTIPSEHFVFYSINVWSMRKALWLLCNTYCSTFSVQDPVTLILKTSAFDSTSRFSGKRFPFRELARTRRSFQKQIRAVFTAPHLILIAEENTPQPTIDVLHGKGDCYVSLTRSEGWGLGAFDAVAAKNPVIMTGYGGQTDFLPPRDAYLVDYSLIPVSDRMNHRSYSQNQQWADPNLKHAGQLMRHVFDNREEARQKGERLHQYSRDHFSEQAVVTSMMSILDAPHRAS